MPPPTKKLASEMLKKSNTARPMMAQTAMTANTLQLATRIVRWRCAELS